MKQIQETLEELAHTKIENVEKEIRQKTAKFGYIKVDDEVTRSRSEQVKELTAKKFIWKKK